MISSERGSPSTPESAVWMWSTGIASTPAARRPDQREPPAAAARGRAPTPMRAARPCGARACRNGTRPLFTRSPSFERIAGRTVSEPTTAMATTRIVPVANDRNVAAPPKYMPAIAAITVIPETSTARPGRGRGRLERRLLRAPAGALLALAAQVEHRVVHAHGEPDQEHHGADRLVHRPDLADRADQADGRATAVIASSSGTNAASSAPKARIRITSVIGSEVTSAFLKSSSKAFESALSALPSPNCSIR